MIQAAAVVLSGSVFHFKLAAWIFMQSRGWSYFHGL